jgi:hypothetical protein
MKTNSLRMPEDIIEDLKRLAPLLGFSGYQPMMRAYVGQGLRADLVRFDKVLEITSLLESLREQGVDEEVIVSALAEATGSYEVS